MNEITCYIWSNPEDVQRARDYLNGKKPLPDLDNCIEILGDIEGFDIRGW